MKNKNGLNLSVQPAEKWFEQIPKFDSSCEPATEEKIFSLKAEAQNLLDSEAKLYHRLKENKKDKDFTWIKKILRAGTLSDKISAHTLLIQDSPVYNISSIEVLIGMVTTKGKRECLMAMDSLQDLFTGDLLIEDKKLKHFNEQPLVQLEGTDSRLRSRALILWLFEDTLKSLYRKFLSYIDSVSHDTIERTKIKAVTVMFKLLEDNPEQEQFLLEHLTNKVGDPIPKVGSHVCYLLGRLLHTHKHMKGVVVGEVERLLFRLNLAERAKYYSLCFLNQIILSHDEFSLANALILIYFSQFKCAVKKGEVNTKMMSALLTGVARAYPYARLKDNVVMEQLDAMYRLVHLVDFNISVQALMLIFQVLDAGDSVSDRFYGALYRKLLDVALSSSSKQAMLLNLVFRALKKDVALVRIRAFIKRLLQVSLYQPQNLQCGILVLVSEINKLHPSLLEVKVSPLMDSDSDEHYEDAPDDEDTKAVKVEEGEKSESKGGWVHRRASHKKRKSPYDLDCRNPLYSNVDCQAMWELVFLKHSFHPSVSLFGHQVANSTEIKYGGDPLLDFTTARFLDRFVYRNPKKPSESFESNPGARVFGSRKLKKGQQPLSVTSEEYVHQKESRIPEEEKFIYQYMQKRSVSAKSKKDDDSDLDSVCSDEFERLLDSIHADDEGKDELNFAKELGMQRKKKRSADSEDESMEEEDALDDEELDDEELQGAFEDVGEDLDEDICEEDFIQMDMPEKRPSKRRKGERNTDENLLADADEFSALLDENAGSTMDTVSGEAFRVKDKTSAKQIAWEVQRDRYVKGKKWQKGKKNFNRHKRDRK